MEFKAISKNVRVSPRKIRTVVDVIKKLKLSTALEKLEFLARSACEPIRKTIQSAVANSQLKIEELKIKNILVDEGIKMRRRDTSHRQSRDSGIIHKRSSHITVILTNG